MEERQNGLNGLIAKWGNDLFDDGIFNAPQCFARYGRRFVSKVAHIALINCMFSYQYGADSPFPSRETLANDLGISVKRIGTMLQELEADGNLEIYWRYINGKRTSSEYNLKPLIDKCLAYSKQVREEKNKDVKVITKKKKEIKEHSFPLEEENSLKEQSVPLVKEQGVPLEKEQSVPLGMEQGVPSKKEREERSLRKKEKNVCTVSPEEQRIIDLINSREDLKTHTQVITKILNNKKKNESFNYDVFYETLNIIDVDFKGINYLTTALMNNLKKGYVKEFNADNGSKGNKREEFKPEWFDNRNKPITKQDKNEIDYELEKQRILNDLYEHKKDQ